MTAGCRAAAAAPFDLADHVETVGVSLRDEDGLTDAMAGMDCVYNLAKSTDKAGRRRWKTTSPRPNVHEPRRCARGRGPAGPYRHHRLV